MRSATDVIAYRYQDGLGNDMVYYCCKTTYCHEEDSPDTAMIDRQALSAVIEWRQSAEEKACMVGSWPAVLYHQDDRTYLCWTISPEYSCVIEYDAEAVAEAEVFRMAESVIQQ